MIRIGILIISDRSSRGERIDITGPELRNLLNSTEYSVTLYEVIPDEFGEIAGRLSKWSDEKLVDIILTSGGTGFSTRDITPEATQSILEKSVPGISEAIRYQSMQVTPHAMLSRAISGIRKQTLIINLPGNPRGAVESLELVLPVLSHAVALLHDFPDAEKGHQHSK